MSLRRSIKRRLALTKGQPFFAAIKVFFADKATRRRLNALVDLGNDGRSSKKKVVQLRKDIFDVEWYTAQHGEAAARAAYKSFMAENPIGYLAPSEKLAGADGKHLSQWGAEFLSRIGMRIGSNGSDLLEPSDPSAIHPLNIRNEKKKRVAVVSAIFGNFDRLLPVDPSWSDDADFYLFTDRHFQEIAGWTSVHANYFNVDPRRQARFVKSHLPTYFHDYDWVMWVDGNILQCTNPAFLVDLHEQGQSADFYAYRHINRSNLVAEAAACSSLGKEDVSIVLDQLWRTQNLAGFSAPTLFATMVMLMRPRSQAVKDLSKVWWRHMMHGSKRDQLALPLAVAEVEDLRWDYFKDSWPGQSPYFERLEHK